jgi:type I restriction-modification system DNA methylase subunit
MAISNTTEIEKHLWEAADELRANSKLKSSEYSVPVLGLIFLRYADARSATAAASQRRGGYLSDEKMNNFGCSISKDFAILITY